ncbi:MAG: AAA family ATPase [Candidatus Margulisiibacteriota bacterium]|jgi:AAA15 family ATPase/GTPase
MQYKSLIIENFRSLKKLEIENLKKVNLLVGRNNCGKTSALEALFLLSGMSNPQLPISIHNFRDLILTNSNDFCYMFYNLDFTIPINLKGAFENKNRALIITPLKETMDLNSNEQKKINEKQNTEIIATTSLKQTVKGINLQFQSDKNQKLFDSQIYLQENNIKLHVPNYKEDLKCTFLNNKTLIPGLDKKIGDLSKEKKLSPLINILKSIEPLIEDVRTIGNLIYIDIGKENLIPLNIMGDGIQRILAILTTIHDMKDGVVLIDEIENGFHYASILILWKAIFAACKEYNVQLIATTHSYECINAFSKEYNLIEPDGDDIRLFRIDKIENKHKAYPYNPQVLKTGIEKEFEVR